MCDPIHVITAEHPPTYPCWLLIVDGYFDSSGEENKWYRPASHQFNRAVFHSSHWSPDAPTPPDAAPAHPTPATGPSDYVQGAYEKTLDDIIGELPESHLARQQLAGIRANLKRAGKHDGTCPNLDPWIQVSKLRAENMGLRAAIRATSAGHGEGKK